MFQAFISRQGHPLVRIWKDHQCPTIRPKWGLHLTILHWHGTGDPWSNTSHLVLSEKFVKASDWLVLSTRLLKTFSDVNRAFQTQYRYNLNNLSHRKNHESFTDYITRFQSMAARMKQTLPKEGQIDMISWSCHSDIVTLWHSSLSINSKFCIEYDWRLNMPS